MDNKRTMTLPYAKGVDKAKDINEFAEILNNATCERLGTASVDTVNWPDDFPYKPECIVKAAWCKKGLGILYEVYGLDLRAEALKDNGSVWEDSCCEFFISHPSDGTYYNFEMNCIGTLLTAKRKSREDYSHFSKEQLQQVKRFSTLPRKQIDVNGEMFRWSVGMFIPFHLIGINPHDLPDELHANFYKCGDKTEHIHFLSWSPISCATPDFHRPEFFGTLKLESAPQKKRLIKTTDYVMMLVYLCTVGFLCFWHFDDMQAAEKMILGIPADKVAHFLIFFPFPILAWITFGRRITKKWPAMLFIIGIFLLGCILGGGIELLQGLTTYRSCDINDFRADALGMSLSSILMIIFALARTGRKQENNA